MLDQLWELIDGRQDNSSDCDCSKWASSEGVAHVVFSLEGRATTLPIRDLSHSFSLGHPSCYFGRPWDLRVGSPFAFLMNRVPGRSKSFGRQEALFLPPGHTGISCLTYSSRTEVKRSPASALGMTRWLPKPPSASRASAAWRKKGTLLNKELVLGLTAQLLRWMRTASAVEDATPTFHGSCIKVLTTWMKIPRRVFSLLPVAASTFLTAGGLGQ
ncbi:unnamed protein product [Victoria cruziana]